MQVTSNNGEKCIDHIDLLQRKSGSHVSPSHFHQKEKSFLDGVKELTWIFRPKYSGFLRKPA